MAKKKTAKSNPDKASLPAYCDYSCRHASFAPDDAVGACRREQAVFCLLLKKFNNKNNSCIARV